MSDTQVLDCAQCPSGTCHDDCPQLHPKHQHVIEHRCALSEVLCVECDHVITCPIVKQLTTTQIDMWARINEMWRQLNDI